MKMIQADMKPAKFDDVDDDYDDDDHDYQDDHNDHKAIG